MSGQPSTVVSLYGQPTLHSSKACVQAASVARGAGLPQGQVPARCSLLRVYYPQTEVSSAETVGGKLAAQYMPVKRSLQRDFSPRVVGQAQRPLVESDGAVPARQVIVTDVILMWQCGTCLSGALC